VTLFRSAARKPLYDANRVLWDNVLQHLNLKLCYQPAIAIVLREGRWEDARDHNHKAYIATAACNQALKLELGEKANKIEKAFRSVGGSAPRAPEGFGRFEGCAETQNFEKDREPALSFEDRDQLDEYVHGDEGELAERLVPPDLLASDADSETDVDWGIVAERAVLKREKSFAVAQVLQYRALGYSRDRFLALCKNDVERKQAQAAWRWVDRSWDTRIAPVLHGDPAPTRPTAKPNHALTFIPAWKALTRISDRNRPRPDWITSPSRPDSDKFGLDFQQDRIDGCLAPELNSLDMEFLKAFENKQLRR
jgi:hypothetical protein